MRATGIEPQTATARAVAPAALVAVLALALPWRVSAVAAQPTVEAETLFQEGNRRMAAREYAQACEAFAASDRIEPSVAAKMKRADCEEKRGRLATAWGLFLQVAMATRDDVRRQAEHQVATARALGLQPRLPHLTIHVGDAARVAGLVITRNGAEVDPGLWNQPVPVDREAHTVVARAPGFRPWSTTVQIEGEGEAQTIDVPRFEVEDGAGEANGARTPIVVEGAPSQSGERSWLVPGGLAVAAVALGGVAVGLEVSARGRYDDAVASQDPVARVELYDSAVTRRRLAIGLGVSAAVAAGAAVWMWRRDRHAGPRPAVTATVVPGYAGVAWGGPL